MPLWCSAPPPSPCPVTRRCVMQDLLIVMGTSLKVQPFASTMDAVGKCVPRLLINRELVGERIASDGVGFRFDTPRQLPRRGHVDGL